MKDQVDLFFEGGLTIRPDSKTVNRKMRKLAKGSRLPFTGRHVVINTARAARRAAGAGIVEEEVISKALQKSLVASGMSPEEASKIKWESMW